MSAAVTAILYAPGTNCHEETAAALDIPEATVRSRFFRARGLLREALSREMDVALDRAFSFAGARCDRIVANVLARFERLRSAGT